MNQIDFTTTPRVDGHPAVPPTTFVPSECRRIDRTWCKQMGFDPNHFYRHRKSGQIFLVLSPGKSGDFAMNKASLDYLAAATTATGTVVLLKNGKSFFEIPVKEMTRQLTGVSPRDGNYGPYWWINDEGRCADSYDDDAPF